MRWVWLVGLFVVGMARPAAAGTMTTEMLNTAFGSQHVGTATTLKLTVRNTATTGGPMAYTVASSLADYVAVPASGTINAMGSVEVDITFTPSARGARNADITVSSDDAGNPSDVIAVTGTGTSGNLTVAWTGSPGPLDFGTVAIAGGTSTRNITISNPAPANEDLKFTLTVSTGATDYAAPATVDVVLAVNASMNVTMTFDPTTSGTRNGSVLVTADDALNPSDTVALTGVGDGAVFGASPGTIDFGNAVVVGTSDTITLTVTNNGNQPGMVTAIQSGNAVFTATVVGTPPLPRTLAPTESVQFTITFTPTTGAIVMSNLTVTTTGTPASLMVPVQGDGLYKDVTVVATNEPDLMIDLAQKRVGVLFTQVVTVTNVGEVPQELALPTSNASDCTIMPTLPAALPTTLDPAEAATFEIRVTPSAVGAGMCTVTVTTDIPSTDTIELTWSGIASEVNVTSPTTPAINFGVVDVDAAPLIRNVVVMNTGSAPLAVGPCTITGNTRFSVVTSCTNLVVAPLASASLMIAFDPTVEASEAGSLTIGVDALSTSMVTIALSGVGADQRLDLSALAISFADTSVNTSAAPTEYIDVFNPVNPATGVAETLNIAAVTTDNAVFVLANEGPFVVEAGMMIRLAITFRPTRAGVYDGTLTIESDATGQPMAVIAMHGRGIVAPADEAGGCCDSGARRPANLPLVLLVLALVLRRKRRLAAADTQ